MAIHFCVRHSCRLPLPEEGNPRFTPSRALSACLESSSFYHFSQLWALGHVSIWNDPKSVQCYILTECAGRRHWWFHRDHRFALYWATDGGFRGQGSWLLDLRHLSMLSSVLAAPLPQSLVWSSPVPDTAFCVGNRTPDACVTLDIAAQLWKQ